MASLFQKRGLKSKCWYFRYTRADGKRVEVNTHCATKKAAGRRREKLLAEIRHEEQYGRDPYAEHATKPLVDHLADFESDLRARGRTEQHVVETTGRVRAAVTRARCEVVRDLDAQGLVFAITGMQEARGFGAHVFNHHLKAARSFCAWLVATKRVRDDPCVGLLRQYRQVADEKPKRVLDEDEVRRLLEAAQAGPRRAGLSGPHRRLVYLTALYTGLRRSELMSLSWHELCLDGDPPTVTVRSVSAKNRSQESVRLRDDIAAELCAWGDAHGRDGQVFPLPGEVSRMIQWDGERAGIEIETPGGKLTFHALRRTLGTWLAVNGAAPAVLQQIMRHRDLATTMRYYIRPRLHDQDGPLATLPNFIDAKGEQVAKPQRSAQGA